jgi:hypothetical protein
MPDASLPHKHHHAVQFYGSDASLFVTVAAFLGEGLVAGQPAIVIATADHAKAIEARLCTRPIDCAKARRQGQLIFLDAEETLDLFMVGDQPNADFFEANVGRLIKQASNGDRHTTIRAYGEMVDVLWKQGRSQAAINVEILWNKLATRFNFALLCGYAMGSFYKQTERLEELMSLHSHVVENNGVELPGATANG